MAERWMARLETAMDTASTTLAAVQQHSRQRQTSRSSHAINKAQASLRADVSRLSDDVRGLKSDFKILTLDAAKYRLSSSELERRSEKLLSLEQRVEYIEGLLGKSRPSTRAGGAFSEGGPAQVSEVTKGMSATQIQSLRQEHMEQQEDLLSDLSKSATRQKEMAIAINSELNVHHHLLDEMDEEADLAEARFAQVNKRTSELLESRRERCFVCFLCLLIVGAIAILMLLWVVS